MKYRLNTQLRIHRKTLMNYVRKLAGRRHVHFLLGAIVILLAAESPVILSSTSIPQVAQQINKSDQQIPQQTPPVIGEVKQQTVRMDYLRQSNNGQIVTQPDASFIKVHFQSLDLIPGDTVTVADPSGAETYTYPGSASTSDGEPGFWSISITGDTAVVQLHSRLSSRQLSEAAASKSGFVIDKFGWGYPEDEIERRLARSTCGTDQRKDVACYQDTNPVEFDKSKAVARLLIYHPNGLYSLCTAWRVGVGGNMLTNQHCLTSQAEVQGSEAWFNYQNQSCGVSGIGSVAKVTGGNLLTSDITLDFSLFTVNNAESIADFGYLEVDQRSPSLGEQIYIPQHGGGGPKQFGIESDLNTGNVCRIDTPMMAGLDNDTDTGYYCDTASGSSGAPILASSSNKVIAMHHFGNSSAPTCTSPNQGIRMDLIWPHVEPYLIQVSPFGTVDNNQPTYLWKQVPGATWYQLWVQGSSDYVFHQWYTSTDAVCNGTTCSVANATPDLVAGPYTWWVQPWSDAGYEPWSSGMTFNVPLPAPAILVSPKGSIDLSNPTYTWNEVPGVTWYHLWVDGPSGHVFDQWYTSADAACNGTTCSVANATPNLTSGTYTWWIQTWNHAGYGPWSNGMDFNVPPPAPAILLSPNGGIDTSNPEYTWNEVPGVLYYYLWVDGSLGNVHKKWYTPTEANCNGTICSVVNATPNLAAETYTWYVQTWSSAGYGPWSSGMTFNPVLPGKATLVPLYETTADHTPVYTWNEVPGVMWYYLWVEGASGTVIQRWYRGTDVCNAGKCSTEDPTTLTSGTYTWWIQTWNSAGYGPWSDGMTFIVSP
jgi:V8-like Glu-specific endopeptidase